MKTRNDETPVVENPLTTEQQQQHQKQLQERNAKKAETARINGAKSKGPITPEGKNKSSQNAIRHGLTANKHTLLSAEFADEYQEVLEAFIDHLRPATKAELRVVQKIANIDWRAERMIFFETALLNMGTGVNAKKIAAKFSNIDGIGFFIQAWKEDTTTVQRLDLVRRYMGTLQHQLNSEYKNFYKLQKDRQNARSQGGDCHNQWAPPYQAPTFETHLPAATVEFGAGAKYPRALLRNEPTQGSKINDLNDPPLRPAA